MKDRLKKVIQTAFDDSTHRLEIHEQRRRVALNLTRDGYASILTNKALDAITRSSAHAHVILTPEQAMRIAELLTSKTI